MTSVAIVGSGQAGTLAAVGLMNAGFDARLYSDRTAHSILNEGPATGTALLFGDSIAYERKLGVETFEDRALPADTIHLYFSPKVGQELVQVSSPLTRAARRDRYRQRPDDRGDRQRLTRRSVCHRGAAAPEDQRPSLHLRRLGIGIGGSCGRDLRLRDRR